MALEKQIELDNGIIVNYHRIVSINKVTNNTTIIEVGSYINAEKRAEEATAIQNGQSMNVFVETSYINKKYNEDETIKDFYEYLKTIDKFKDAEDI